MEDDEEKTYILNPKLKVPYIYDDFSVRMAEQTWLEVKGYPMPEGLTDKEKSDIFTELWPLSRNITKRDFNFLFYKKFDISQIKKEILNIDPRYWKIDTYKQDNYYIHKDTETLGNTVFSIFYKEGDPVEVRKNIFLPKLLQRKTDEIILDLEDYFDGKVVMSGYTKLLAGGQIPPHIDNLTYFKLIRRFQICISSNPYVYFTVGKEEKVFGEGECYQIDNTQLHSVYNRGETDRINLIVDICHGKT